MAWSTPPWVRRTFTLDPRSLAAFRIAIGSVVLADALLRGRDASLMLAPDGMFPLAALRDFFGDHWAWSLAFLVDATWWGVAVLVLEGVAGAGLAVGLCTRPATIAAWVAVVSIVRRTAPATNAGDEWLCCLLFWAMFLPLGAVWSVDAVRSRTAACAGVVSPAGIALVLQMAAVYLGAGLAKLNPTWLAGDAVARALSWHDHGTALGQAFSLHPLACRLLTWGVVALELAGPCLLVASGRPTLRGGLVAVFLAFHAAAAVLMSLGLFAYVGMAAWLAFIPGAWWGRAAGFDARAAAEAPLYRRLPAASAIAVVVAAGVAALSFLHENTHWRTRPLPRWLRAAVRATCLGQDWGMFGEVAPQRQWVYGRGTLADGRV
ncbi:MAG: hypothetical protein EBR28_06280, partial [Planctomycetia bacterium]|nr:hypothetical protein [Planctomycetia bacterium]